MRPACLTAGLLLVLSAAGTKPSSTAEAWVRGLYQEYGKDDRPDPLGALAPKLFAPRLLGLIQADEGVAAGDIGKLDEDPLCACQDDGGFRLVSIGADPLSRDRTRVTAHMVIGIETSTVVLDLDEIDHEWRIADIHNRNMPSLLSYLSGGGFP